MTLRQDQIDWPHRAKPPGPEPPKITCSVSMPAYGGEPGASSGSAPASTSSLLRGRRRHAARSMLADEQRQWGTHGCLLIGCGSGDKLLAVKTKPTHADPAVTRHLTPSGCCVACVECASVIHITLLLTRPQRTASGAAQTWSARR